MWQRNDASGPMARPHVTASLFDKFLVLAALTFTLRLRLGGESIKPSDFFSTTTTSQLLIFFFSPRQIYYLIFSIKILFTACMTTHSYAPLPLASE
jgi:hypothetical protein